MSQIKRETATICRVGDILKGDFVKADGWTPSYFVTDLGNISRVNIMGVLVTKGPDGLVLDDGSGQLLLRSFGENNFDRFSVGDFILLIGRPRMYNDERYIMPEIIKIADSKWIDFRKMQIELMKRTIQPAPPIQHTVVTEAEPIKPTANYFQKIVQFIKDLDSGDGAPTEEVVRRSTVPNADDLIMKLIEEGEIFEIKPGRLKILE